eukprot:c19983_g1_i1.p1 GENE.c19983_g1_i1~~c19983_g1_i1.p1  ORF type:complete len:260 (-),score=49.95 c19983_g1_i1:28-807(-)
MSLDVALEHLQLALTSDPSHPDSLHAQYVSHLISCILFQRNTKADEFGQGDARLIELVISRLTALDCFASLTPAVLINHAHLWAHPKQLPNSVACLQLITWCLQTGSDDVSDRVRSCAAVATLVVAFALGSSSSAHHASNGASFNLPALAAQWLERSFAELDNTARGRVIRFLTQALHGEPDPGTDSLAAELSSYDQKTKLAGLRYMLVKMPAFRGSLVEHLALSQRLFGEVKEQTEWPGLVSGICGDFMALNAVFARQ